MHYGTRMLRAVVRSSFVATAALDLALSANVRE